MKSTFLGVQLSVLLFSVAILVIAACSSSSNGANADGGTSGSCSDLFTTATRYSGNEQVSGCYYPGTYAVDATITQTKGSCNAEVSWQARTSLAQLHTCAGTISGDAARGYDVRFCADSNFEGTIHFPPDLSTFGGSFDYSASCGNGTTTFEGMTKE